MPKIRLLGAAQVRELISPREALDAVRAAFVQLHRGEASVPNVLELRLSHNGGEAHGKGAYVNGSPYFTIKVATGFAGNRAIGVPETSGLSLVFDANTGFADVVLFDNGYLTQLRTGSAGALAADLLAREDARTAAMIGAGVQARFQLESLLLVRAIERVAVASRSFDSARRFAEEMSAVHSIRVEAMDSIPAAIADADIVVTTTPAEEPIIAADWVRPGVHVTAIGSDFPGKHELDSRLLARSVVVADNFGPDKHEGEIYQAVASGLIERDAIQTLGAIAAGEYGGRTSGEQITVADLTGVGVQDAAVAAVVASRAREAGIGLTFDPDDAA